MNMIYKEVTIIWREKDKIMKYSILWEIKEIMLDVLQKQ